MKSMVVYSSKTGNTKKIAQSVLKAMPEGCEFFDVQQAPDSDKYDFIAIGFWVDKGMPDENAKKFMNRIKNKKIGLFMTLGAYPDSEHALKSMENAKEILRDNKILGTFTCQGKVDPELVKWMQNLKKENPKHPHSMDEKRRERLSEAEKHPDKLDCTNAYNEFKNIVTKL